MALTCKVVMEIQFSRSRMPKKFLEAIVKDLAKRKGEFIDQYKVTDPGVVCKIYYKDYTVPQVTAKDLIPKPRILNVLRKGKSVASIFKPSVQNNDISR